jgi:hypothetical protein
MKRLFIVLFFVTSLSVVLMAQQQPAKTAAPETPAAPTAEEIVSDQVYREIPIETFETVQYTDKNATIQAARDEKVSVQIRSEYPAPIKDSKKYLGVKVHGKSGNSVKITPPEPLAITEHCQSISAWVYGKNFSGELRITLRDSDNQNKIFSFGKLNFLGWRKLTIPLPKDFSQEDKYLAQPKSIYIVSFIYNPGRTTPLNDSDWEYFYIDDITAKVRKKYVDKQSDTW